MADKVWQVVATWLSAGQYFQNVMHYRIGESGTHSDLEYAKDLRDGWSAGTLSAFLDCLSSSTDLRSVRVKRVSPPGSPTSITLIGAGTASGTRGANINDTSIGACLEWPVNLHGKNVTGKVFISGVADADIVNNEIAVGLGTAIDTLAGVMITPISLTVTGATARYTIYNRAHQLDTEPTDHSIGVHLSSQRRRLTPVLH